MANKQVDIWQLDNHNKKKKLINNHKETIDLNKKGNYFNG